jgi:uncharacterized protein (TIGR03437 family)
MGFMKTKTTLFVLLLCAGAGQLSAQSFDSSGDGMLNGTYYFRQVLYFGGSGDAANIVGNIVFNGAGSYTLSNATLLDMGSGSATPVSISGGGNYFVSASGEGFITALDSGDFPNDRIIGLVSHGVFIGSSTETTNGYNDLFIAAPIGSTATNATLSGSYKVAYFDPTYYGEALLSFNANGSGNIGTVNATEYLGTNLSPTTQTLTGVTYSFSNGAAQLNFGGKVSGTSFLGGTDLLYTTPDGNFIFGGNFNGFDMFVGVKNATSDPSSYQNLYYQAGIDLDLTGSPNNNGLDSYFGATNILSGFTGSPTPLVAHQRDNSLAVYNGSSDISYSDGYSLNGDGSANDCCYTYWTTTDGSIRIGYGAVSSSTGMDLLGINVAFQAPSFSGPGVYLYPNAMVNAASNAPFTAFVSPGEFLTLYGTNLASKTDSSGVPFLTTLDNVQVFINGVAAPIYFVSPSQVSVVVPYFTTQSVAQIQVVNSQGKSNIVTQFTGETSVGVFTNTPVGGLGIAAAELEDFSVLTEDNPAPVGKTVSVYVSGMGAVSNYTEDGTAAPGPPNLAETSLTPAVYLTDSDGNFAQAVVSFSGLAPTLAGLYQINFAVPSGLVSGDTTLDIYSGLDSETVESTLPITNATSSATPAARANSVHQRPRLHRQRRAPAQ